MRRIAVIGSGITGLAVAHALAPQAQVTLFEADALLRRPHATRWTSRWTA